MTYYTIAVDPQNVGGRLHTFSASESLSEMLSVCSVYLQLNEILDEQSMSKVTINYD